MGRQFPSLISAFLEVIITSLFPLLVFPNETDRFHVLSITEKNNLLPGNSQDHVISFGALSMYLYEEEMEKALQGAIRIAKPCGHLCFTHFVEPLEFLKVPYLSQ